MDRAMAETLGSQQLTKMQNGPAGCEDLNDAEKGFIVWAQMAGASVTLTVQLAALKASSD